MAVQVRVHALKITAGSAPVECNASYCRVSCNKPRYVVCNRIADCGIHASFPPAESKDIPEGDPVLRQEMCTEGIGKGVVDPEKDLYDPPELVFGITVVLAFSKRYEAGKAAEDKDFRIPAGDGGKARVCVFHTGIVY